MIPGNSLPVTIKTFVRAARVQEREGGMSMDSLVNLMLDAYESIAAVDDPDLSEVAISATGVRERRRAVLDGNHYCELYGEPDS